MGLGASRMQFQNAGITSAFCARTPTASVTPTRKRGTTPNLEDVCTRIKWLMRDQKRWACGHAMMFQSTLIVTDLYDMFHSTLQINFYVTTPQHSLVGQNVCSWIN